MTETDKTIQDLRRIIDELHEQLKEKDEDIARLEKTLREVREAVDEFLREP